MITAILIVGVLISFAGGLSYFIDTLKGKAKPNRVTWSLWALAPFIALAAQIHEGVGLHALITFMAGFNPLLIVIASFIGKQAEWKLSRFDIACGVLAIAGLILWQITNNATYAVLLSIAADLAAGLPTVVKAFTYPETENYKVFIGGFTNAVLTLAVTRPWSIVSVGFTFYLLTITFVLMLLIRFRFGKRWHQSDAI